MKKSIKRVASVFATVTMLAVSAVPAFAAYPSNQNTLMFSEQDRTNCKREDYAILGKNGQTAAPNAEDVFTVDGKSFVLIDKNDNGDYFVTTKEPLSGTHKFYNGDANSSVDIVTATKNGDSYTFTPNLENNAYVNTNWMYSVTNQSSIGYKVNANLSSKTADGIGGYKLPDAIIDNLVETQWGVEGTSPIRSTSGSATPDLFADLEGGSAYSFANLRDVEGATTAGYTVTAKVALPSYTEYKTYWDKLGFAHDINNWTSALMTRTPHKTFRVPKNTDASKVVLQARMGQINIGNTREDGVVVVDHNTKYNDGYRIRPVFFLNKDFFKTVKVEVADMGANVKAEVTKNTAKELIMAAGYTETELTKLGYDVGFEITVGTPNLNGATNVAAASQIDVSVSVKNMKDGAVSPAIIIAVYDSNNTLKAVEVKNTDTTVAEWTTKTLNATLTKPDDVTFETGDYGKVMVWDNLTNIKPYVGFTKFD